MFKTIKNIILGLKPSYYFRQLFFGALLATLYISIMYYDKNNVSGGYSLDMRGFVIYSIINTLLYPYARYVYERIVDFIMGDNVFYVNAIWFLVFKFLTMFICWALAIFIFPIGLILYFCINTKSQKKISI